MSNNQNTDRFFIPHVGERYQDGIHGKKLLVLGASFYCKETICPHYEKCTGTGEHRIWSTRDFDCDCNGRINYRISQMPSTELDYDGARSYRRFVELMCDFKDGKGSGSTLTAARFDSFWETCAFTNYIQRMIGGRTTTKKKDIREKEDMNAFLTTLDELMPDIVIVWGCVIDKVLKKYHPEDNVILNDYDKSDDYLFRWTYKGKRITFLCLYHPSSSRFYSEEQWEIALKYLELIFLSEEPKESIAMVK